MSPSSTEGPTAEEAAERGEARRELSQLLHVHERLMGHLHEMRSELEAPSTRRILRLLRKGKAKAPDESFGRVTAAVEEAVRTLQVFESDIKKNLLAGSPETVGDDLPDLPRGLARFLAEKTQLDGFSYELSEDSVRGWTICWKEYNDDGSIRGYGQIYERPHAWLHEE